jgi:TP901 family phage tail tape measure protein
MLLGTDSVLNIGINIYGKDNFTGAANTASRSLKQLENDFKQTMTANLREARNFYGTLAAGAGMALGFMVSTIKKGAEFDLAITQTGIAAGATNAEIKALTKSANELGMATMFSPQQIAQAQLLIARAGYGAKESIQLTKGAALLAAATGAKLEGEMGTADVMQGILHGFNIEATKSTLVADQLTYALNKSAIGITDIGEGLKYASATSRMLGMQLPDIAAMIMMMGNINIKGSQSGVVIENMLRYLAKAMSETKLKKGGIALRTLGLTPEDLKDARGNLLPIGDVMQKIGTSLDKFSSIDKLGIVQDIFQVRGAKAAYGLINQMKNFKTALSEINSSAVIGTTQRAAEKTMNTLAGSIERVGSAWESFGNNFSKAMEPVLIPLLNVVGKILEGISAFATSGVGGAFLRMIVIMTALKAVSWAYKSVIAGLKLVFIDARINFDNMATAGEIGWGRLQQAASKYARTVSAVNQQTSTVPGATGTTTVRRAPGTVTPLGYSDLWGKGGKRRNTAPDIFREQYETGTTTRDRWFNMSGGSKKYVKGDLFRAEQEQIAWNTKVNERYARMRQRAAWGGGIGSRLSGNTGMMAMMGGLSMASGVSDMASNGMNASNVVNTVGNAASIGAMFIPGIGPLAAMGISMGTQLVTSLVSNALATEENTNAQQENSQHINRANLQFNMNVLDRMPKDYKKLYRFFGQAPGEDYSTSKAKHEYMQNPNNNKPFYDMSNPGKVTVYLNGKIIDTKDIEQTVDKQLYSAFKLF